MSSSYPTASGTAIARVDVMVAFWTNNPIAIYLNSQRLDEIDVPMLRRGVVPATRIQPGSAAS